MDPFVALTAAAAATERLLVGTGVCLVAQRDVIQTAKLVASLDQVSGGRFLFGVGDGWNAGEMANHGTAFGQRHKVTRERIEAMRVIWTEEVAEYHGAFVDFGPMMAWPKPVQVPHPPVLVGGAFPYGARRAIRYGQGWMPHRARPAYPDVAAFVGEFRQMVAAAGRDPAAVPVTIWGASEEMAILERDRGLGVVRTILSLESARADVILPQLDRWARIIERLGG
jgi:probable F420-dependent oxidoreductase